MAALGVIPGPVTAECSHNICDECVGLCLETIAAYMRDGATKLRHFIEQGD